MTKKHYKNIAKIWNKCYLEMLEASMELQYIPTSVTRQRFIFKNTFHQFAEMFQKENPAFNYSKFHQACFAGTGEIEEEEEE